jgi:wobble nucleotide-excising tRNase
MKWFLKIKTKVSKEKYDTILNCNNKLRDKLIQAEISRDNAKNDKELLEKKNASLESYNKMILNINEELRLQRNELHQDLKDKEKLLRELRGSKGGYKGHINRLKREKYECDDIIKRLKEEIKDLKSTRYLVREIPPGRIPKTQKIKVRNKVTPKIANYQKTLINELE